MHALQTEQIYACLAISIYSTCQTMLVILTNTLIIIEAFILNK